ncbi:MAG TPA: hypothetical protein VH601_01460 [Bryobacteraceae bacterium]|jgi:uncharacterized membrane protein
MKRFFIKLRDITIAGFFFLLPLYIAIAIVMKAWTWLSSLGSRVATMFGVKSILGLSGHTIFSGLLLLLVWLLCGILVRLSFVAAMNRAVERWLSRIIPGYDAYKAAAEEKLRSKPKILPYGAALLKHDEFWQPAYIVEQDSEGNYVVFLPDTPETNKGHVLLARQDQVRVVSSVTASQVDASLKQLGKGLLTEYRIQAIDAKSRSQSV